MLLSLAPFAGFAQFTSASVRINGLTCSSCSMATEKAMMSLDFVEQVVMNLDAHVATVTFKAGQKVSLKALAQKVVDAGFSVGHLEATLQLNTPMALVDNSLAYGGDVYRFVSGQYSTFSTSVTITLVGSLYMDKGEFKKWKSRVDAAAKPTDNASPLVAVYYVTTP